MEREEQRNREEEKEKCREMEPAEGLRRAELYKQGHQSTAQMEQMRKTETMRGNKDLLCLFMA